MKFSEIYDLVSSKNKSKMQIMNESSAKELKYAIVVPEVKESFIDFLKTCEEDVVLIGGVAVSTYVRPRMTMDVDFLIKDSDTFGLIVKEVSSKFKKISSISFQHNRTHCEVEVISPEKINQPTELFQAILDTAVTLDLNGYEVKMVSLKYLVVLKLGRITSKNRRGTQDKADIFAIFDSYGIQDISDCVVSDADKETYDQVVAEYKTTNNFSLS